MKLTEIRMVSIDKIDVNPYRNLHYYPLIPAKIEALKASFSTVGVWPSIIGRPAPNGKIQQAFGHQRIAAAKDLGIAEVPVIVSELTDEQMVQYMGRENGEDYNADFLIMLNTWEAGQDYARRRDQNVKATDIARLLGWTRPSPSHSGDMVNDLAAACAGASRLIDEGYLDRTTLDGLNVRAARDIVGRGLSRMESIERQARLSGAAAKDVTHAKSMVGKGMKATARETREGNITAKQISGRVDVNAFKAAGQSKAKASPLFAVFGHAVAESINKMLAFDATSEKLEEIAKVVNQVIEEEDRRILSRIDFELDMISDRASGWRKRLTPNKVKPFPASVKIGGAE
jgi:ParB/RepB/Spo0J family partition protein